MEAVITCRGCHGTKQEWCDCVLTHGDCGWCGNTCKCICSKCDGLGKETFDASLVDKWYEDRAKVEDLVSWLFMNGAPARRIIEAVESPECYSHEMVLCVNGVKCEVEE